MKRDCTENWLTMLTVPDNFFSLSCDWLLGGQFPYHYALAGPNQRPATSNVDQPCLLTTLWTRMPPEMKQIQIRQRYPRHAHEGLLHLRIIEPLDALPHTPLQPLNRLKRFPLPFPLCKSHQKITYWSRKFLKNWNQFQGNWVYWRACPQTLRNTLN